MSTALERAIEQLSGSNAGVADALRGLLVVSRRIGATAATSWLRSELDGFEKSDEIPAYRIIASVPIEIRFDGYGGSWQKRTMTAHELPAELGNAAKDMPLIQPVAELEGLAGGDQPPQIQLPGAWLQRFRELADQRKVPHLEMSVANDAILVLPQNHLRGVLDRIKSAALDFALDIEEVSTAAGGADGPTVATDPRLAQAVAGTITHIYAKDSNITLGDNASVASGKRGVAGQTVIQVGDVTDLLREARTLLSDEGVAALVAALEVDGGKPAETTRTFLGQVQRGGVLLASGISQNAAYDGLVHLLSTVFPGFS